MPAPAVGDQGFDTHTFSTSSTNAAALSLVTGVSIITTAGAETRTLAAGTRGQVKVLYMKTDGGDCVVTLTGNPAAFDTVTLNDAGDTCVLLYIDSTWVPIANVGCTIG